MGGVKHFEGSNFRAKRVIIQSPILIIFVLLFLISCNSPQKEYAPLIVTEEQIIGNAINEPYVIYNTNFVDVSGNLVEIHNNTATIKIIDDRFLPEMIFIRPGTQVTWINTIDRPHIISDFAGLFRSRVFGLNDAYSRRFYAKGEYNYKTLTLNFRGKVIVI